ncbi:MAG TPA: hypothetical protein VN974_09915 [Candidatus Dormibacteraeota bacterium]|nr:hypothetical protein [Candidatus Dormibacteraeota bacterium]
MASCTELPVMSAVVNDIFMPLTLSLWKLQPVNPAQQLWILQSPDHTEEAAHHFGWFAHFAGLDCPASSKLTQERLVGATCSPA